MRHFKIIIALLFAAVIFMGQAEPKKNFNCFSPFANDNSPNAIAYKVELLIAQGNFTAAGEWLAKITTHPEYPRLKALLTTSEISGNLADLAKKLQDNPGNFSNFFDQIQTSVDAQDLANLYDSCIFAYTNGSPANQRMFLCQSVLLKIKSICKVLGATTTTFEAGDFEICTFTMPDAVPDKQTLVRNALEAGCKNNDLFADQCSNACNAYNHDTTTGCGNLLAVTSPSFSLCREDCIIKGDVNLSTCQAVTITSSCTGY